MNRVRLVFVSLLAVALVPASVCHAFEFDFHGSLGEGRFRRYVPPVTNPLLNETPYITTEIRPIYLHNDIPNNFLTSGGKIDLGAVELRLALTERLGFIASKDGYAGIDFERVLEDEEGFANISFGFKYAVLSRPEKEAIVTVGVEYEPPTGNLKTSGISLQGEGDGLIDLFVSAAKAYDKLGFQASMGFNVAIDGGHDSSQFHYSLHVDYEALPKFYPLIEFNGFTTIDHGNRTPGDFEGIDLVNFGSTDSGTVVTFGVGARYRLSDHLLLGAAYETPLTDREDIMNWRVYVDAVITF